MNRYRFTGSVTQFLVTCIIGGWQFEATTALCTTIYTAACTGVNDLDQVGGEPTIPLGVTGITDKADSSRHRSFSHPASETPVAGS